MKETVEVLISESAILKRVSELSEEIAADYKDEDIFMLCVLKGGVIFMVDLARCMEKSVEIDFMDLESYGQAMKSSGKIEIIKDLKQSVEGKNVLVVEDIVDTGRTLKFLLSYLKEQNPKSLKVCTLLDKPEERVANVTVDYAGFTIPNKFVVGYGLDYAQKYRNLRYIGTLTIEE